MNSEFEGIMCDLRLRGARRSGALAIFAIPALPGPRDGFLQHREIGEHYTWCVHQ